MPTVIKRIKDEDGELCHDKYWHYGITQCGDPAVFCTGEFINDDMVTEIKEGRITCPDCRKLIKAFRTVDLR